MAEEMLSYSRPDVQRWRMTLAPHIHACRNGSVEKPRGTVKSVKFPSGEIL